MRYNVLEHFFWNLDELVIDIEDSILPAGGPDVLLRVYPYRFEGKAERLSEGVFDSDNRLSVVYLLVRLQGEIYGLFRVIGRRR